MSNANYVQTAPDGFTVSPDEDGKPGERKVMFTGDVALAAELMMAMHYKHTLAGNAGISVSSPEGVDCLRDAMALYVEHLLDHAAAAEARARSQCKTGTTLSLTGGSTVYNLDGSSWSASTPGGTVKSARDPKPAAPAKRRSSAKKGARHGR